jgi:cell migration-inducing and hyaluronan-binding protein
MGTKVLGVHGSGRIDLHGAPRISWVKLGATAEAGAAQLTLARSVDWEPGDRIVVTATGWDARESEEATIAAVTGAQVTLAGGLRHRHFGRLQQVDGITLDERGEVGLLSHTVQVTSAFGRDSLLGGHVIFTGDAQVRVSDVEFSRLGQPGQLGRYSVHWHLMGDAPGTYVRRSSVHHGLQRGIIVHGTHQAQVRENVVYDVRGHGVYVEDGSERGTVIEGNLAALARQVRPEHVIEGSTRPDRHDGRDTRASNFWFATANSRVVNNVAAGSEHGFGYWYDLATGNGHHPRNGANSFTMGEFTGNVAHSQGNDPGTSLDYHPLEAGTALRFDGENFTGRFRDFTAWKNMNAAVWYQCSQDVANVVSAGNRVGAMNFCFHGRTATLRNSVVISETENRPLPQSPRDFFASRSRQANHAHHGTHQDRRNVPGSYPVVMPLTLENVRAIGFP